MLTIQQFKSPADVQAITAAIKASTGAMVGVAVKQGLFTVTRTAKTGGKWKTEALSAPQSHAECMDFIRSMGA